MRRRMGDVLASRGESKEALEAVRSEIGSLCFQHNINSGPFRWKEISFVATGSITTITTTTSPETHRAELGYRHDDGEHQ